MSPGILERVRALMGNRDRVWLVTGVAGFIGSNLLEALLRLDQRVVGFDNFATGFRENLEDVRATVGDTAWSRFRFLEGDLRDAAACVAACDGIDAVLHQAALGSVPRSLADPISTNATNIDGFLNILVAARDAGVEAFVYAASSSTYGDSAALPKVEHTIGKPLSPYAVTKYVNEVYADVFARAYGMGPIGLRYFNVFGPRQDPDGAYAAVIPRWIDTLMKGERCRINGDGETTRDFCYVDNVVQANLLAVLAASSVRNEVFNVAVGGRTSLNTLYRAIRSELCRTLGDSAAAALEPEYGPFRDGDVRHSQANIEKARAMLGYEPTHDLARGLEAAMPWYVRRLGRRAAGSRA